jgi:putative acetyltransferase
MISVQKEDSRATDAVRAINLAAFEGGPEADLVDALRESCPEDLSLDAHDDGQIVGHLLFSLVTIDGHELRIEGLGLAPGVVETVRHRAAFDQEQGRCRHPPEGR